MPDRLIPVLGVDDVEPDDPEAEWDAAYKRLFPNGHSVSKADPVDRYLAIKHDLISKGLLAKPVQKGDRAGHPFRGNQWTKKGPHGEALGASFKNPVKARNIDQAIRLMEQGKHVELQRPKQTTLLLDRLKEIADEAAAKGEKAPSFNLCNVQAKGTNVFCVKNKGIPRIKMPQLSGVPTPGSKADKLPKNKKGEVDLSEAFKMHLATKGIDVRDRNIAAARLKPSQNELNGAKVAGMMKSRENGTMPEAAIFVSRDGYVVDGHHRWAAALGQDLRDGKPGDIRIPVLEIDMPILSILLEANAFAKDMGIPQAAM